MMQAALDFTAPPAAMEAARNRADVGVQRTTDRADKASPEWSKKAADMLRIAACILHAKGIKTFTVEQCRELVADALPKPPDGRAWGGATRGATARGFIVRVPGKFAPAASSNGSGKPMYEKGPKA